MRRESFVALEQLTADELAAFVGADPRYKSLTLVRRQGEYDFISLRGRAVAPGDEVIFYEYDPTSEADLVAINRRHSPVWYLGNASKPWADELALIAAVVPATGARVLEICAGAGRLAGALVRDGNAVTALDIDANCVVYGRALSRGGVTWAVADAGALPFPDGAFEVACVFENSLGVLFSKMGRALAELVRVTRTRVILGLREDGPDPERVHVYYSDDGNMEVARTFTVPFTHALLDGVPTTRIRARTVTQGEPRPWGGHQFFVVLDLDVPGSVSR